MAASVDFPEEHRPKICLAGGIQRPNGGVKQRTNVVGRYADEDAVVRLVDANPDRGGRTNRQSNTRST